MNWHFQPVLSILLYCITIVYTVILFKLKINSYFSQSTKGWEYKYELNNSFMNSPVQFEWKNI